MKHITTKTIFTAFAVATLVGCKPDLKAPTPDKGSLDVTKYVSIGNSITSGFADGALYYEGQKVSYVNLLAEQFKLIGGGEFNTPWTPVGTQGIGSSLNARLVLGYKTDCKGVNGLSPVPAAATGDISIFSNNISAQGPFNNMGVPGAKATTVVYAGYGNTAGGAFNPFFTRMIPVSEQATASMLSKAAEQKPTFFSVFIGNNDVLGNALAGGMSSTPITPSAGAAGTGFDASIDLIVNTMLASGNNPKGVIASIPDITNIPHFTTVPYNGLTLDATQAAGLNAAFGATGATFTAGSGNAFMIVDVTAPGGVRQIKSNEYILLGTPQDSLKCAGWGTTKPLADQYVLTAREVLNLKEAASAYNAKIKTIAAEKDLAFVDVDAFMANAKKGITYNGITSSAAFVSGGAFSLDGIHLTPRGNAMLANEFIKAINLKFGASIPQIDVTKYNGVVFP